MTTDEIMALADMYAMGGDPQGRLRAAVEQMEAERSTWKTYGEKQYERAERAERERDEARALLRHVRGWIDTDTTLGKQTYARIDAFLENK